MGTSSFRFIWIRVQHLMAAPPNGQNFTTGSLYLRTTIGYPKWNGKQPFAACRLSILFSFGWIDSRPPNYGSEKLYRWITISINRDCLCQAIWESILCCMQKIRESLSVNRFSMRTNSFSSLRINGFASTTTRPHHQMDKISSPDRFFYEPRYCVRTRLCQESHYLL